MKFLFPSLNPVSEAELLRQARQTFKEYSENHSFK